MSRNKSLLGLGAVLTAALTVCSMGSANADLNPSPTDAVGIGSDTVQNMGNFLADGDNAGNPGYNSAFPKNRMVSFDATPDANDRAGYLNGSSASLPKALNPTIVLRQGLQPVQRPNGSGSGVAALVGDIGATHNIDFVRMSRLPKSGEYALAAAAANVGPLRAVKISTDNLKLATATTTNAPATLTAAQIVSIYQCTTTDWMAVGGTAGTIVPQIPQSGSGTGDTFRADLATLNGGPTVTLGGCVQVGEENDPAVLASNPNAIGPFSEGRKNLYDSGYFNNPANKYGTPQVALTSGIKFNSETTYTTNRGLFIVFRDNDTNAPSKFQPGGSRNIIRDLFYNPGGGAPFVQGASGQADITAAGGVATYVVCAVAATTC